MWGSVELYHHKLTELHLAQCAFAHGPRTAVSAVQLMLEKQAVYLTFCITTRIWSWGQAQDPVHV